MRGRQLSGNGGRAAYFVRRVQDPVDCSCHFLPNGELEESDWAHE